MFGITLAFYIGYDIENEFGADKTVMNYCLFDWTRYVASLRCVYDAYPGS